MIFRIALTLTSICVLFALLTGCASVDTKANTISGADLSKYSTYTFQPLTHTTSETRIDPSSPAHVELKRLINDELTSSGLTESKGGELSVKYAVARLDSFSRTVVDSGDSSDFYRSSTQPNTRITAFEEGSLLVDISDAASGKLLWRGTAKTPLYDETGPVRDKARLQRAVHGMFADFRR